MGYVGKTDIPFSFVGRLWFLSKIKEIDGIILSKYSINMFCNIKISFFFDIYLFANLIFFNFAPQIKPMGLISKVNHLSILNFSHKELHTAPIESCL